MTSFLDPILPTSGRNNFKDKFVPRKVADRSHLLLEFPQTNKRVIRAYIPMLENVDVNESQKASLTEYNPIGRSGSVFSYMGAKSRNFNVKFTITLLHLLDYENLEGLDEKFKKHMNPRWESKELQQQASLATALVGPGLFVDSGIPKDNLLSHAEIHREFYRKVAKLKSEESTFFDAITDNILSLFGVPKQNSDARFKDLNRSIDIVMYWINLIRATTLNNAKNTALGPPIVRLTHGVMYNNVPCVCESYNIRIIKESGYDAETLLPRQVEVSLNLQESRLPTTQGTESNQIVDADGNVGWEAVLHTNNLDPYNGDLGVR